MLTETFLRKRKMLPLGRDSDQESATGGRLSYTQIVKKRAICDRLNNFVRLCDFIVLFSMRRLAHDGARRMLEVLT